MPADIKLFVCCHKYEKVPEHPLLVPIQVGAALAEQHFDGFLHDDTGENISTKNRSYCELTAQYWAWKNVDADYYGFFHYRRYLYPDTKALRPYRVCGTATDALLKKMGFDDFGALIKRSDMLLSLAEDMHVSVRDHYANAPYHHEKDIKMVERIVVEKYPEIAEAMESYLTGTKCYFGNICIMKKHIFDDYCDWIFSILEEFDRRVDTSKYGVQEKRVNGYLAERLLGVYYTHNKNKLKSHELPRVHFENNGELLIKKKIQNFFLPPGSRFRAVIKAIRG